MSKVSVIVPARNEKYLSKTIDDLFEKATGEIEVIVILDGYWPDPPLKSHKNLIIIHRGEAQGMREGPNTAVEIASGEYLMKCDAHCLFGEGYDEILKADCEKDWLCVPSRYSLDAEAWTRTRGPIDYLFLTYPYTSDKLFGTGFHGKKWIGSNMGSKEYFIKETEGKDKPVDDIMTFQGSCWFMHKQLYLDIGKTDPVNYYFFQEAQELGFKVWLSGGRVVRNKKTWYAHHHKNKESGGRGYRLSNRRKMEAQEYSTDLWMNNKWSGQTRDREWLIDKFWPVPGWPDDWKESACRT